MKVDEKDKASSHETPPFLYQVSQAMMLHICEHGGRNSGNTTRGCPSLATMGLVIFCLAEQLGNKPKGDICFCDASW